MGCAHLRVTPPIDKGGEIGKAEDMAYVHPAHRRHGPRRLDGFGFGGVRFPGRKRCGVFLALCAVLLCLQSAGAQAAPDQSGQSGQPPVTIRQGEASYLARKFHGRRTASGETYREDHLTAAHRSLPFGTVLRVTRLSNGRSVVVRVNDRGPFVKGRYVDVSREAARRLNMLRSGVTTVRYEIVGNRRGEPLRRDEAFYLVLRTASFRKEAGEALNGVLAGGGAYGGIPAKARKALPRPAVFAHEQDARLPGYFVGLGPFATFDAAHKHLLRFPPKHRPDLICARAGPPSPS